MIMVPPKKPTPVRDARKNVQDERSQLMAAKQALIDAKANRPSMTPRMPPNPEVTKPAPRPAPRPTTGTLDIDAPMPLIEPTLPQKPISNPGISPPISPQMPKPGMDKFNVPIPPQNKPAPPPGEGFKTSMGDAVYKRGGKVQTTRMSTTGRSKKCSSW